MTRQKIGTVHASARVRRMTGRFGFFCDVEFQLITVDQVERRLLGVEIPPRYRAALMFGIDYSLERAGYDGGWDAHVERFEYHAVDTTCEVVALTAAQAVFTALGMQRCPTLDAEQGLVSFPK